MTRTEKDLAKALEALKEIADGKCLNVGDDERFAAKVYAELTAPRTERVEVKRWVWKGIEPRPVQCPEIVSTPPIKSEEHLWIELTGHYDRPVNEEGWECEVKVVTHSEGLINGLPVAWEGRRVRVELVEEGE